MNTGSDGTVSTYALRAVAVLFSQNIGVPVTITGVLYVREKSMVSPTVYVPGGEMTCIAIINEGWVLIIMFFCDARLL